MRSLKKLADLADRFELKIKYAQSLGGEDPKSVTADAFFGPQGEQTFQNWILRSGSKFLSVLPDGVKCAIGAKVDTDKGVAAFLVTLNPPSPKVLGAVTNALVEDYKGLHQGKDPVAWQAERLAKPPTDPLTLRRGIVSSHPAIINVT